MFKFFKYLANVSRYKALPREQRRVTFYCEGKNYWPHLSGIVKYLLDTSNIDVCYVSSSPDDPGLALEHKRLHHFVIGDGAIRNWFFENQETEIMVMTMPDLHQYQVKRSSHLVHYVYVQHSMVSLHMVYREGAFDYFDSIFCSGPHHVAEVEKLVETRNLSSIVPVQHGYGRLDSLWRKSNSIKASDGSQPIVLIAPTWGANGIIEIGVADWLIQSLLDQDCKVILRPHPQTLKFSKDVFLKLTKKYGKDERFSFEVAVDGETSLLNSTMMISDWSGAALEYSLGLNKPVIFMDVPRKVNNLAYEELGIDPFEDFIREEIGIVIKPGENFDVRDIIARKPGKVDTVKYVYNLGHSEKVGAEYIQSLLASK